jgi:hypothetical protein
MLDLFLLSASLVMHGAVIVSLHSTLRFARRTFVDDAFGQGARKPGHIPA